MKSSDEGPTESMSEDCQTDMSKQGEAKKLHATEEDHMFFKCNKMLFRTVGKPSYFPKINF